MDARTLLNGLREGKRPTAQDVTWFVHALGAGQVSEAQVGAFAMAICIHGLDDAGRVALTLGMRDSGDVLNWDLPGPVVDKHSTGGVGDSVSLILAPALAVCGAFVPMISGRGLGHTGGTLDKLEAIPGFRIDLSPAKFQDVVRDVGCAIVASTARIAPADKVLYGIRDVTGTVKSLDLITASILSKKLAAGLEGLVLDVKIGTGAFMKTMQEARDLARSLVDTANGAGCATSALITDMSQPLLPNLGNALEVAAVMDVMCTPRPAPILDVVLALGAQALIGCGLARDDQDGQKQMRRAIWSGDAARKFAEMVAAQGGPPDFAVDWATHLPSAPFEVPVRATSAGFLSEIDGEALGLIVVHLGGGRTRQEDVIDPRVGLADVAPLGATVQIGTLLATIHASDNENAARAEVAVLAAMHVGDTAPILGPLVIEKVI